MSSGHHLQEPVDEPQLAESILYKFCDTPSDDETRAHNQFDIRPSNSTPITPNETSTLDRVVPIWRRINHMFNNQEETIENRWKKKGKRYRENVVRQAFAIVMKKDGAEGLVSSCGIQNLIEGFEDSSLEAILGAQLSVEIFCDSNYFISLLKSRCQKPPDKFLPKDASIILIGNSLNPLEQLSQCSKLLRLKSQHDHTLAVQSMFSDESQDHFDAIYRAISGSRVHTLGFQELLLEFLGNTSKLILHDKEELRKDWAHRHAH